MAAARSDTCNFVKMFETWLRTVFRLIISSWEIVALPAHGRGRRDPDPSTDAGPVSTLADDVLPLIRTRTELYRWSAAKAHGAQMHAAVDILKASIPTTDPVEIYSVTHKALASAIKVIARADDSSGIIGDACRRLSRPPPQGSGSGSGSLTPGKLVEWMLFQFGGDVDYFELDPVAYLPALGESGMGHLHSRVKTRLTPINIGGSRLRGSC